MDHLEGLHRALRPWVTLVVVALALLTMFACSGSEMMPEPTVPSEAPRTAISANETESPTLPPKEQELYDAIWKSSVSPDELRALISQDNLVNANDEDGDRCGRERLLPQPSGAPTQRRCKSWWTQALT